MDVRFAPTEVERRPHRGSRNIQEIIVKIVFIDWKCFDREDTVAALKKMGHEVIRFSHPDYNAIKSPEFDSEFAPVCAGADAVFSYNFFPAVAETCHKQNTDYISLIYDSPYVYLYSFTMIYPTNHVYLFDSSWVEELHRGGLTSVRYAVLPACPDKMKQAVASSDRTRSDISFVGALYNEAHNFYDRFRDKAIGQEPDLVGYIDGILEAQSKLYGFDVIRELMTQDLADRMTKYLPMVPDETCAEPVGYRFAAYLMERRLTSLERQRFLSALGKKLGSDHRIKLFTLEKDFKIEGIENCGIAEYEYEMPRVFADSRINLNISLRSIHTGIPLRCMDIMGCGGFLLTNYQADFQPDFVPGEDFDWYGSEDELLEKCEYYLGHEKERAQIAANGARKVRENYSIEAVLGRILSEVKE